MTKCLILLIIFVSNVSATSFLPVSVKKQITESNGILEGEVINSEPFYDDKGAIHTRVFLKVNKWIGVTPTLYHTEVYVPGGTIGDRAHTVEGAPQFSSGERVVLMLKNYKEKQWVLNLGLGKFSVKKIGNSDILINSIFPQHPKVSQIPLNTFYSLASRLKNKKFKERVKDKYELELEKHSEIIKQGRVSRKIASTEDFEKKQENSKNSTVWILLILGCLLYTSPSPRDKRQSRMPSSA